MLHHLLKRGDLTRRSERNAVLTRTLVEAFKDRHKVYTNLYGYSVSQSVSNTLLIV